MTYDQWKTQTDYDDNAEEYAYMEADHRLKEINQEIVELEEEIEYALEYETPTVSELRDAIAALEAEAEKIKIYLGISEW